jgi:ABC-type transport system involved in cytochrome c biogenesis permease subunit
MLTWANMIAGWWTSAAVSAIQRQQSAVVRAMFKAPGLKPARRRRRRR